MRRLYFCFRALQLKNKGDRFPRDSRTQQWTPPIPGRNLQNGSIGCETIVSLCSSATCSCLRWNPTEAARVNSGSAFCMSDGTSCAAWFNIVKETCVRVCVCVYIDFGHASSRATHLKVNAPMRIFVLSSRAVRCFWCKRVSRSCNMQVACLFRTSSVCYIWVFCQI